MSFGEERRPDSKVFVILSMMATILVHGGIVALVLIGRAQAAHKVLEDPLGQFVDVQAVRFGKPRDLSFLPHKEAPQAAVPKPQIALTDQDQALPRLKDETLKNEIDDPLKRTHSELFKNALDDKTVGRTTEGEGDPNGVRGGTATEGRGPVYYQHLQAAVQNAWVVPTTISEEQLVNLRAQACIKISEDGTITEVRIVKPSSDERFDTTLLAALRSIQQFEPPTPDVRSTVSTEGVCMNFAKTR